MLDSGFVKLYRSFLEWEWYADQNTKSVFLHLILTANYEDKKWRGIVIKRGQRVTSYGVLADELKLSVKAVRTAINHLKRTGEVAHSSTPQYGLFTVINYDKFQNRADETADDGQSEGSQAAGEGQQLKKDNKDNNISLSQPEGSDEPKKPKGRRKRIYDHDSTPYKIALAFEQLLNQNVSDRKPTTETSLQTWADSARMLLEADKYSKDEIWQVMKWAQNDDFWKPNIMSVPKLRKHFERLRLEIAKSQKQGAVPGTQEPEVDYNRLLYDRG